MQSLAYKEGTNIAKGGGGGGGGHARMEWNIVFSIFPGSITHCK